MAKKFKCARCEFRKLDGKGPLRVGDAFEMRVGDTVHQFRPVAKFAKEKKHD